MVHDTFLILPNAQHCLLFKVIWFCGLSCGCPGSTLDLTLGHFHRMFPLVYNGLTLAFLFDWTRKGIRVAHALYFAGNLTCIPHDKNMTLTQEILNNNGILKGIVIAKKWHKKLDCETSLLPTTSLKKIKIY